VDQKRGGRGGAENCDRGEICGGGGGGVWYLGKSKVYGKKKSCARKEACQKREFKMGIGVWKNRTKNSSIWEKKKIKGSTNGKNVRKRTRGGWNT